MCVELFIYLFIFNEIGTQERAHAAAYAARLDAWPPPHRWPLTFASLADSVACLARLPIPVTASHSSPGVLQYLPIRIYTSFVPDPLGVRYTI